MILGAEHVISTVLRKTIACLAHVRMHLGIRSAYRIQELNFRLILYMTVCTLAITANLNKSYARQIYIIVALFLLK